MIMKVFHKEDNNIDQFVEESSVEEYNTQP
jgi:hypothetical protein